MISGKTDEAIKILKSIHGSEQVAKEEIIMYASSMNNEKVNKMKLIKNPIFLKSLCISVVFAFSTQLVGFTAVSFYLQTILESTKTNVMPEVASVIMSLIQLFASFCSTPATHWFKRRHILMISFSGILIGMVRVSLVWYLIAGADLWLLCDCPLFRSKFNCFLCAALHISWQESRRD